MLLKYLHSIEKYPLHAFLITSMVVKNLNTIEKLIISILRSNNFPHFAEYSSSLLYTPINIFS